MMNAYPTETFQSRFFEQLERQFDKRGDMVNATCETLHLGRDAVYRRLRGDTLLTANELMTLAQKFNIQLDEEVGNRKSSTSQLIYPQGINQVKDELEYFEQLESYCQKMINLPEVEIDYATPELPLYYEGFTPTLLAFKTYVYGLTSWNFEKWKGLPFSPSLIDPKMFEITERFIPKLFKLPGRELWSIGILDITLRQIEHAVEVGQLNDRKLVDKMFEELEDTIRHMEDMARFGKKFLPGEIPSKNDPDFQVYHNEMTNTNNVIIIKSPLQSFVFSTFVNPNYIISTNERIQVQMETWFNNLVDNSNCLSKKSSKYYRQFFARLRRTVHAAQNRVNGLLI
ncbi:hypothetical protein FUA23_12470 [Neolewinella aurantiaca]|uniref:Transcription regulator BetR N-terminal domain-containing protein n=1 Tax=Neolewinella aurantiaca TaxID=2602767 RepID=A0A5C7FU07_9BACT|nr:hypothetical protein [Neolewinella aurantiaca]TXF88873.1 hypothetical protein FUA23_12470 [Neolewinella aurantiaca]